MDTHITLGSGEYLAPISKVYDFEELLVGVTKYESYTETGKWHSHEKPMISLVLKGGNLENRKGEKIERIPGAINFYHAFEPHNNIYKVFPSVHMSLEFDNEFLKKYNIDESDIERAVHKNQNAQLTFMRLLKEASVNDNHASTSIQMLMLGFLDLSSNIKYSKQYPQWIITIRDILHDRWDENISLSELSLLTGIHPCTISKYFKRYFCCTLGEYVRKLKVEHALDIIRTHHYSLTEVALICGFSDQSHFTRIFKSLTGYAPKEFRRF